MKVVAIMVLGSESEPLILELSPGMTAGDLMAEAGLAGYLFVRKDDPGKYLLGEEDLYTLLTDCELLYASMPVCEVY
jgi:hypothetical protein